MTTVLLAHGSPDPRHSSTLERLRERVEAPLRTAGRGPTVLAYLENDHPHPKELGTGLTGDVTLVPMLITPAFHARVDVPAAVRELSASGAQVTLVPALGGHPLLLDAVDERLRAAGHDPDEEVLLVAGGSSSGQAGESLRQLVADGDRPHWTTSTLAAPRQDAARGRIVVPATLAEGVLHDQVEVLARGARAPFVRGGLADSEALKNLVVQRVLS